MQRLRLFALLALCVAGLVPVTTHAQTGAPVQIGTATLSEVGDWEGGTTTDLLVTNNGNGELRLASGSNRGIFESSLLPTNFRANAVGLTWKAQIPEGTLLSLEVRGGAAGGQLGAWQPVAGGDTHPNGDSTIFALESVRALPDDTNFLQLRVTLSSTIANASPELSEATLTYYNTQAGPSIATGLPRVPILAGAATLTPAPQIIERLSWSGGAPVPLNPARLTPRGVVLHQIGDEQTAAPLSFLRALLNYHTKTLGWDDLPYHYIIDRNGLLYEGRIGGPTSASRQKIVDQPTITTSRMAGGDAVVHIALIGSAAPTPESLATLTSLAAWLGQAYTIAPLGTHRFLSADGTVVERPNIVGHSEIVSAAADPSAELRNQIPAIRQAADQATVRARYYFAEGNVFNYAQRLAVINPTTTSATVRFLLLRQPGPAQVREVTIAAGGRADLVVNDIFADTTDVPVIVESNAAILAERYMDFGSDISMAQGVRQPSRVWYFAEGATDETNRTYLLIFNPQLAEVQATIKYVRDDGIAAEQSVRIPALQRRVVVVGDKLSGARFGMQVIATRPVITERTMIFGAGSSADSGGVHTTAGVTELSRKWYFAEGTTAPPFTMAILVMNPNAQPVQAAVTFMTPDGTSLTRRYAIPATTRLAIPVNDVVPQLGVATTVVTDRPVAVERSITWADGSVGTAGAGATNTAFTWRFADGRTADNFQQFLLISNPGAGQARVTVEYVLADGTRVSDAPFTMPARSRQTIAVHTLRPGQQFISATIRASQPIVAERSLYRGDPRALGNRGGETVLGIPGDLP
jgi:hypothetical protein